MTYTNAPAERLRSWSWRDYLTREELQSLREFHDLRAWIGVLGNWAIVFGAMAWVAVWPNPLTVILALFLIGARQLGLAIQMHDASHFALFRSKKVNDFVATWLCAYPVWSDLQAYRRYHMAHHARTWTLEDPDLSLATPFPITRASLRRKIWRDLSGQTGWKRVRATLKGDLHGSFRGMLLTNAVLFGLLAAAGHPLLYLLWPVAWLTTNMLVTRIRAIAEHSMVTDPGDPLRNTRTTIARWWERLFIAPNHVNYHLEHHLLMTVPPYQLPRMHRLLRERGALEGANVVVGYPAVLRLAASKDA